LVDTSFVIQDFSFSNILPKSNEISKQAVLALSSSYLTHLHQEQTVANLDYKKGISA